MSSTLSDELIAGVRAAIRDVPDFPKPGIVFKDITPILADRELFPAVVRALAAPWPAAGIDRVAGIEARGFLFAAPLAIQLGAGFVPIRKPGKLPRRVLRIEYDLEYGVDALEAHEDAIRPGDRVLLVDDVLATGGTAAAAIELIEQLGGRVIGAAFVVELGFLDGRSRLAHRTVHSLVRFDTA